MITTAFRITGPTYALSVAATQHADVAIKAPNNETCNYALFLNTGATSVCVVTAPNGNATPTVVFPVDATPTDPNSFVLPPLMTTPLAVSVQCAGPQGYNVAAIGSAAGPSIIYVTPIGSL